MYQFYLSSVVKIALITDTCWIAMTQRAMRYKTWKTLIRSITKITSKTSITDI